MRRIFNMFLGFVLGFVLSTFMILSMYGSRTKETSRKLKETGRATKAAQFYIERN